MFTVTKTYGHDLGLSACFRQWRAKSHCRFIHGYALSFEFEFAADKLDENGWVLDFGGLKPLKDWLVQTFDHKLLVAEDDPQLPVFLMLARSGQGGSSTTSTVLPWQVEKPSAEQLADVLILPRVGCEAFAEFAFHHAEGVLHDLKSPVNRNIRTLRCTVREHGANGATYHG